MASTIQTNFRVRHAFAKIAQIIGIPNLIDIQKRSYEKFLQANVPQNEREEIGLQGVFRSVEVPEEPDERRKNPPGLRPV